MDISPTALTLGKELFELDPRQNLALDPQFLTYDGRAIPLPSGSVDRIVSFDAFHHIPNQDELLREIFRVLKVGGRVVFAEPGEGHSHAGHSTFEEEQFGVLENDIDLRELANKARAAGFDGLRIKPFPDVGLTMTPHDYFHFMDGADPYFPTDTVRASLTTFHIFTLTKGEEIPDSRNPRILRAAIHPNVPQGVISGPANSTVRLEVRVENTGDTIWLDRESELGGYVRLAGRLRDPTGASAMTSFGLHLAETSVPGRRSPFSSSSTCRKSQTVT
jgi:hypothetical protein